MSRFKLEGIFILVLALITALLFFFVPMDKLSFYDLQTNYLFSAILYLIIGCVIAFNYYVLEYAFWLNLVIVVLLSILARFISFTILRLMVYKLNEVEKFQYKWLELLVIGVAMVLLSEVGLLVISKFPKSNNEEDSE
jgi:hypothetical protein